MYILDTCILNILFHDNSGAQKDLKAKLETVDDQDIWVSVVTIHELLVEGIAPAIKQRINTPKAVLAFNALMKFLDDISEYQILPYTEQDDAYFRSIPAKIKQEGSLDCKIAPSAVSNNFIVVTSNTGDFKGTGAKCEDWTRTTPD